MLRQGLDVIFIDNDGESALFHALEAGDVAYDCAQELIDSGANTKLRNFKGQTIISSAIRSKSVACVRLALKHTEITARENISVKKIVF